MRKTINYILIIIFTTALFYACSDIYNVSEDISKEEIKILSPREAYQSENFYVSFWWEPIEGADFYQFTLVRGTYDSLEEKIIDTALVATEFYMTLFPSVFEVRLFGWNDYYTTDTVYRTFTIDSTAKLQQVNLSVPTNNYITNDSIITFSWLDVDNADQYYLEVLEEGERVFQVSTTLLEISSPSNDPVVPDIPEGQFVWSVVASNSKTSPSTPSTRIITIDRTAPKKPLLKSPVNKDTIQLDERKLEWTRKTDGGTEIYDSVYIYSDSLLTNIVFAEEVNEETLDFDLGVNRYFWRVISIDLAGNKSEFSVTREFYIE